MDAQTLVYLFMVAAGCAGAALGFVLLRNNWRRAFGAVFMGHAFIAGGLYWALRGVSGTADGVMTAIFLTVFVLPATSGLVLGAALGWLRGRRDLS
ncbi:hypothetical protein [Roseinatronobacter sp.]